jgi:FtsZ-binding cell division protein ZapB
MNMKEHEVESTLRKAPQPKSPDDLRSQLVSQIKLPPRSDAPATSYQRRSWIAWLRYWWPALAPAAVSLACAAVMVSQQMEARELKQNNQQLQQERARLLAPQPNAPRSEVYPEATEQAEIARLRERAAQLTTDLARLENLQRENTNLRKQSAVSNGLSQEELDAAAQAREKAMSIQCVNNLKQIGLAVRVYAMDNKDVFPPDFLSMSNELNTPKILWCPADTNRVMVMSFAKYTDANTSYEYLTPSATNADQEPQRVLIRCPIHGHIGLCDGSVQGTVAKRQPDWLIQRDNKLYYENPADSKP